MQHGTAQPPPTTRVQGKDEEIRQKGAELLRVKKQYEEVGDMGRVCWRAAELHAWCMRCMQ